MPSVFKRIYQAINAYMTRIKDALVQIKLAYEISDIKDRKDGQLSSNYIRDTAGAIGFQVKKVNGEEAR